MKKSSNVLGYVATVIAIVTTLVGGIMAYGDYREEKRQHLLEDERRDERIRVLQNVLLSEHPEYTLALFPGGK